MEITPETIYWISRLDSLQCLSCIVLLISGIVSAVFTAILLANCEDGVGLSRRQTKAFAVSLSIAALSALALTFVPGTKEGMAIYMLPKLSNSKAVKELAPDAVEELAPDAVEELAPDAVEELAPDAVEELAPDAVEELAPDAVEAACRWLNAVATDKKKGKEGK